MNKPGVDREQREALAALGIEPRGRARRWLGRTAWLVVLAAVAGAGYYYLYGYPPGGETRLRYITDEAVVRDLSVTVSATGNLEPTDRVDVSSEQSGRVAEVLVDFNDTVTAGQVLARLDTTKLEADVLVKRNTLVSSEAAVAQARAALKEARLSYQRISQLFELSGGRTPSQLEVDAAEVALTKAEADLTGAQAAVAVAAANLEASETDLDKARIVSPIDGVVLSRQVEPGQTVAASLSAPTLFVLARDLADMELHVDIDEADIGSIRTGQRATFTVDAYPDRTFTAAIEQIRLIASDADSTTSNVVAYETVLKVRNTDHALLPGMTAIAEIAVASAPGALTIANAALRYDPTAADTSDQRNAASQRRGLLSSLIPWRSRRPQGNRTANASDARRSGGSRAGQVWVLRDGQPIAVTIETGLSDGLRTQVLSGDIRAGDAVIADAMRVDS